ncbi:MAG: hypothetical protein N2C14_33830 [Planctomycetales bacterium]
MSKFTVALLTWIPLACLQAGTLAAAEEQPDQAALEKHFQETMTGAVLVGAFTIDGKKKDGPPKEERYTINKVVKEKDDLWVIHARMQYGGNDFTVPVSLYVKWAGDTPVLTLTDLSLPGLGTFSARVLIYRDHYAGFWQHGKVTGNMFGRLEHPQPEDKDKKEKKEQKEKKAPRTENKKAQ